MSKASLTPTVSDAYAKLAQAITNDREREHLMSALEAFRAKKRTTQCFVGMRKLADQERIMKAVRRKVARDLRADGDIKRLARELAAAGVWRNALALTALAALACGIAHPSILARISNAMSR